MKILAVVVRYQTPLSESIAFQGLCDAFSSHPEIARSYTVMIWDNSPEAIPNSGLSHEFVYSHSKVNLCVSGAYNGAMQYAVEHGYPWMLLLDQDTKITHAALVGMLSHCHDLLSREEIAAIAPTVCVGSRIISPVEIRPLSSKGRNYPAGECGIASGEATAINSGCIIRVGSLRAIGGFSLGFWLDYSDIYVFHQFFLNGMKVWRAADVQLEHDLSIMDYDRLMTPWRCKNRSCAETAFTDLYNGSLENAILTLRLFARAIKQRLKYQNPEFSRIAWGQLKYRLRVPREERISRWFAETKEHAVDTKEETGELRRPILQ
jgi:GT2 family glycosyltransferase